MRAVPCRGESWSWSCADKVVGSWLNSGPLMEQHILITTEPSLRTVLLFCF